MLNTIPVSFKLSAFDWEKNEKQSNKIKTFYGYTQLYTAIYRMASNKTLCILLGPSAVK